MFSQPSQSKDITQLTGVALDGVPLYSGSSFQYDSDAYYPTNWGLIFQPEPEILDSCLGSTEKDGTYKYRVISPCVYKPNNATGSTCQTCAYSIKQYVDTTVSYVNNTHSLFAISKDGRAVYSVRNNDTTIMNICKLDLCNGGYVNSTSGTQMYSYFMTDEHPYGPACWGPA